MSEICAEQVRLLTGFDRVMVYRFDPDWNGEVIAECKREDLEAFLGLHYPASDIPQQARELYTKNWLRFITDRDYVPSALSLIRQYRRAMSLIRASPCSAASLRFIWNICETWACSLPCRFQFSVTGDCGDSLPVIIIRHDTFLTIFAEPANCWRISCRCDLRTRKNRSFARHVRTRRRSSDALSAETDGRGGSFYRATG